MMMNREPVPLTSIHDIDLDHHAVIEASAGTGKTYCIENLVVRILLEKDCTIDQILLVTFTEKATGELHKRIRDNIVAAIADSSEDPDARTRLQDALENFDTAQIFTIHGFCQRMLQQYAFENGEGFQLELVSDRPVFEKCLHEQQRRDWPRRYQHNLEQISYM